MVLNAFDTRTLFRLELLRSAFLDRGLVVLLQVNILIFMVFKLKKERSQLPLSPQMEV